MSFILDALKKSDSDRQRKSQPESAFIATGPGAAPNSRWLWLVGALLAINVVVLSVVLLRPAPQSSEPAATATAPPQTENANAQTSSTFRELVSEAKRNQTPADRKLSAAVGAAATESPVTADEPVQVSAPEKATTSNEPSTTTVAYKTFNEVRAEGSVQLPDLHLDLHVYDEVPSDRFVFVNMSKYKENSTLGEGPTVTEIVPEGVILQHSGVRFLLPRE